MFDWNMSGIHRAKASSKLGVLDIVHHGPPLYVYIAEICCCDTNGDARAAGRPQLPLTASTNGKNMFSRFRLQRATGNARLTNL